MDVVDRQAQLRDVEDDLRLGEHIILDQPGHHIPACVPGGDPEYFMEPVCQTYASQYQYQCTYQVTGLNLQLSETGPIGLGLLPTEARS